MEDTMTKYIDTDKLKAEIERLTEEDNNIKCKENENFCSGYDAAFYDLLSFINSLQQEQPEVDLDKEINSYCGTRDIRPVPDFMDAVARHFYELGRNSK